LPAYADSGFFELSEVLSRIQQAGNIGMRVVPRKDGSGVVAVIRRADPGTPLGDDSRRARELLGLADDVSEFEVVYGLVPSNPKEVALLSRSMMEIMLQLGFGIDLPVAHLNNGSVLPGLRQVAGAADRPLVHIRSGRDEPADAYAAVAYKGHWY
jgi:hypothetical protein